MNYRKLYDLVNALDHLLSSIAIQGIRTTVRNHGTQLAALDKARREQHWENVKLREEMARHRRAHQNRPCPACQALREDVARLETIVQPEAYCWDARCSHPGVATHPHLIISKYRTL